VVIGFDAAGYALVADGEVRKINRPKKKNPKHLIAHEAVLGRDSFSNSDIRAFIVSHSTAEKEGEEGSTVHGER